MRVYLVLFLISVGFIGCNINTIDYQPESRNVMIVSDSVKIYADVSVKRYKGELKNNLQYYWYSSEKIGANYGGFNGSLLNGIYKEINLNGGLNKQGTFTNGLKDGVWKYWYPNGSLKRIENWSKGTFTGKTIDYNLDGTLKNTQTSTNQSNEKTDSTNLKAPWYKRFFKKDKKLSSKDENHQ